MTQDTMIWFGAPILGLLIAIEGAEKTEASRWMFRMFALVVLSVDAAMAARSWHDAVVMVAGPIGLYKIGAIVGELVKAARDRRGLPPTR